MGTLTKAQRAYLELCSDWIAIFEILERQGRHFNSSSAMGVRVALGHCVRRGLCSWSSANNTYRITDAGRAALNPSEA